LLRPEVFRTLLAAGRQYDAATDPAHPSATRSMSRATIRAGNRPAFEEAGVGPRRTLQLLLVLTALATLALALTGVVGPA